MNNPKIEGKIFAENISLNVSKLQVGERIPIELAREAINLGVYSFTVEDEKISKSLYEYEIRSNFKTPKDLSEKEEKLFKEGFDLGIKSCSQREFNSIQDVKRENTLELSI